MVFIREIKLLDSIWGIQFNPDTEEGCSPYVLRHCSLDYKRFSDHEVFPFMTEKEAVEGLEAVCHPHRLVKLQVAKELTTVVRKQVLDKVQIILDSGINYTPSELLTLALKDLILDRTV